MTLAITILGHHLPGRACAPHDAPQSYRDVHVGLCDRSHRGAPVVEPRKPWGVVDVHPGDAESARWDVDVTVKEVDGTFDFGGPFVRGKRGDRHLALAWGELRDGTFALFRVAKLPLEAVGSTLVRDALEHEDALVGRVDLTDARGNPRCATVHAPDLGWRVEAPHVA